MDLIEVFRENSWFHNFETQLGINLRVPEAHCRDCRAADRAEGRSWLVAARFRREEFRSGRQSPGCSSEAARLGSFGPECRGPACPSATFLSISLADLFFPFFVRFKSDIWCRFYLKEKKSDAIGPGAIPLIYARQSDSILLYDSYTVWVRRKLSKIKIGCRAVRELFAIIFKKFRSFRFRLFQIFTDVL